MERWRLARFFNNLAALVRVAPGVLKLPHLTNK